MPTTSYARAREKESERTGCASHKQQSTATPLELPFALPCAQRIAVSNRAQKQPRA
jgi:hypothetical protein